MCDMYTICVWMREMSLVKLYVETGSILKTWFVNDL